MEKNIIIRSRLEEKFNTVENGQDADDHALKMVREVYEPVIQTIDHRYSIIVAFKQSPHNYTKTPDTIFSSYPVYFFYPQHNSTRIQHGLIFRQKEKPSKPFGFGGLLVEISGIEPLTS